MLLARVGADFVELKRHADAIRIREESIALEEELVKADPLNVQFQFDLADMYGNLAASQRENGQLDAALRSITHSIDISERAAARNPGYVAHRFNFGAALSQLGQVQRDRGATADAISAFRRSIAVLGSLGDDQRDPAMLIAATSGLGQSLADEARRSQSVALWREARTTLQQGLDGWRRYQQTAGAGNEHRAEIERLVSALKEADGHLMP